MKAYLSGDQSYIVKLGKTPGDVYGLDITTTAVATNDFVGTYSVSVSDNNCLLKVTMVNSTSATVKVLSQKIST